MVRLAFTAIFLGGLSREASAQTAATGYFMCVCPGRSAHVPVSDSSGMTCVEACGGPSRRASSQPDWNAIRIKRQREEADRQKEREDRLAAAEKEREEFEKAKAEALRSLKSVPTGGSELKGFSGGTDAFGLKGVDANSAGLKGLAPEHRSPAGLETSWSQLVCAASIGQAAVDAAGAAKTHDDLTEVDYLRAQTASAMIGGDLGVGCAASGKLASSFKPWKDSSKKRYDEFLRQVASWARSRVEIRAKIPAYRAKVLEAEKKLEALRRAPAIAKSPAPEEKADAPSPPTDDDLRKRAEKALAESKALLASAEHIDKENTAKLEKADKAHEELVKAPAAGTPEDLFSAIAGDGSK